MIMRPMVPREPVYCNRLVRGPHGETIFLKANALPPAEHITNEIHRRATKSARDVLSNGKRFGDHAAMNASSETIDDAAVKEEFMASTANPWNARYSPYVGNGIPSKRRMTFDSHLDRLLEKLFKKKPTTVMEVYDKCMLFSCLDKHYGNKRTIGERFNYLKEKVQIAMMSSENRHGFVMAILEKEPVSNVDPWNVQAQSS